MTKKHPRDRFALSLYFASAAFLLFGYGVAVGFFHIFPFRIIDSAIKGYREFRLRSEIDVTGNAVPWYFKRLEKPYPPAILNTDQACPGVNLVAQVGPKRVLLVKLMDLDGRTLHRWDIDWFELWPDAQHVPDRRLPKAPPGTHVDAGVLMENGDLVFTFAGQGLVRLDPQGEVVWRLPCLTHHSIERGPNGNFWVCGQKYHTEWSDRFPNQTPPFVEETLLEVTPEGKVAREWSVRDLFYQNGLTGLLYFGTLAQWSTQINGNNFHLNDVEPFPEGLEEGFFKKGDVLVSLRNNNTVFVFDWESGKIKHVSTGRSVRQHDPDFIDGNSFSIFDNNLAAPRSLNPQSRIAIVSAPEDTLETYLEGTPEHPFYTAIWGKHQWLPNGNLLITESWEGKAFEVDPSGKIVWQYINYVDDGVVGLVEQVKRLPLEYVRSTKLLR